MFKFRREAEKLPVEDRHITLGDGEIEMVVTESTKTVLLYVRTPPPAADGDNAKTQAAQEFEKGLMALENDLRAKGYFFAVFTGNG